MMHWVTRRSLLRIDSARMLQGSALNQAPFSTGFLWMIDGRIALGPGTIVAVLALDAHHHQRTAGAPSLQQGRGLAGSVAASWTGDPLAAVLKPLLAVMGRPAAARKDGGSDRHQALRVLEAQGRASPAIDDISHAVATRRKRRSHDPPTFSTCGSACGRVSGTLTHTLLACLAPPTVHTTARCLHGHRLVPWADRWLTLSPAGGAKAGSTLATLRAGLEAFPACKALITRFRDDAVPLRACQKMRTTQGLSHDTLAQCEPLRDAIPSATVRRECAGSRQSQLQTATTLGLANVGVPLRSDRLPFRGGHAPRGGREQGGQSPRAAPARLLGHAHPGGSPSGACGQRG
jgi:hypothetical protein